MALTVETLPDGTQVLRVDVTYKFTEREAATVLATLLADRPVVGYSNMILDSLGVAARQRLPKENPEVSEVAIEAYSRRLRELLIFPPPAQRKKMIQNLRSKQKAAREVGDPQKAIAMNAAARAKLPRTWAYHDHPETGEPVLHIEVREYCDLDQTALAMAMVVKEPPHLRAQPVRIGDRTVRDALRAAKREGLLERDADELDETVREWAGQYRVWLQEQVFTG